MLGFVLEAISGSRAALGLIIVVAFAGIFMAIFNEGVTKKRSQVCKAMIDVMLKIEERLEMPFKPQKIISTEYEKGSQTKWSKRLNWGFSLVWVIVMGVAGYKLFCGHPSYSEQRFIHVGATYIMFDEKTAQACWSGPPGKFTIESPEGKQAQLTNEANLPFCKDLR